MAAILIKFFLLVIKIYQKAISPMLPARCRFYPTCSSYGAHALTWHGIRGIALVLRRILRCHPWGGSGVDFVPLPLYRYQFKTSDLASNDVRMHFVYKDIISYQALRNHLINRQR